jgi:hypothetical protein
VWAFVVNQIDHGYESAQISVDVSQIRSDSSDLKEYTFENENILEGKPKSRILGTFLLKISNHQFLFIKI